MKIILVFTKIGTLSLVFLLCLLCLQSNGAVIGEDCTVDVNCTNSNGACVDLKCGCVATHYIDGSECTPKKQLGGSCTSTGKATECLESNSICTAESGGNKCRCP